MQNGRFDTPEDAKQKEEKATKYAAQKFCDTSHCDGDAVVLEPGKQTLFVNASIKGDEDMPVQLSWLVELGLPKTNIIKEPNEPEGRVRGTAVKSATVK